MKNVSSLSRFLATTVLCTFHYECVIGRCVDWFAGLYVDWFVHLMLWTVPLVFLVPVNKTEALMRMQFTVIGKNNVNKILT